MLNTYKMERYFVIFIVFIILSCNNKVEHNSDVVSEKVFLELDSKRYNVAFLIMDGTYNTELTAPFDIFQHTIFRDSIKAMNVFTVAIPMKLLKLLKA